MTLDRESIEGWRVPPEKILRFPVDIRTKGEVSVFFGIASDTGPEFSGTRIVIEFYPKEGRKAVVTESGLDEVSAPGKTWLYAKIPFPEEIKGPGELAFVVEPPSGEIPDIPMLWGAPSIYYPDERSHKNVLLIGVDTLRSDSVGIFGGRPEITPNLDTFLKGGTIFKQARAQSSWTLPSFASMITGKLPSEINSTITTGYLPDDATTLGEILLPDGYATMTVCSNVWLGNDQSGFEQGMEELWYKYDARANESVDIALDFMNRNSDRDWFCFLHFIDPHSPYEPPKEFQDRLCDPAYDGPYKEIFHNSIELKDGTLVPEGADLKQIRDLYDGEIAHIDAELGRLFDYMAQSEMLDDTLIIFAADHGEEFYDHGEFDHGHSMYDEMIRLPLGIYGEGFPADTSIDTAVGNDDIFPTILTWLGKDHPDGLAGIPLQDIISGNVPSERIIFGEGNNRGPDRKFATRWPYKCIMNFTSGELSLYDLETDPLEKNNIFSDHQETAENLAEIMTARMLPDSTMFNAWFLRNDNASPVVLSGTITVEPGITDVRSFGIDAASDSVKVEGNTIIFQVTNSLPLEGIDKHLAIFPTTEDATIDITLQVNGKTSTEHLFPYGTMALEQSGHATVNIADYPLGPDFNTHDFALPPGLYIWGVQGFDREKLQEHFDPESWDEIRSLGYVN